MPNLMSQFPSPPEEQVSLANWRMAPFSEWAFHHVREIVVSADVPNNPNDVWQLEEDRADFSTLTIEGKSLAQVCDETKNDGLVILHKGKLVHESYGHGMDAVTPHILMSVSKSVLGLLGGILVNKGLLDTEALLTDYIPELEETAWKGATVREALDMRVGILFDEDYLITEGAIIDYRKATNWNPLEPGDVATDLRSFFLTLTDRDGPHSGKFHYVSPNTDLLAWVYERASGQRYADLLSNLLWRPMGAERSAYFTVDRFGAPRAAGGVCVTTRDLARLGQLVVQGGSRDGQEIIPKSWIDDITLNGDPEAWQQGEFAELYPDLDAHYRSKCYVLRGEEPLIFGLGIHGQNVFADPVNDIVIAKHSCQALPIDDPANDLTMKMVEAVRNFLKARG
jgi:CubicO group peptidase (beta-lactamase class C family)